MMHKKNGGRKNCLLFITLMTSCLFTLHAGAQSKSTYLLVHGAWHDAWSWHKVVPLLEKADRRAMAFNLPGHGDDPADAAGVTMNDYVQRVKSHAMAVNGKVILVGHSMAGVVIARAAEELGAGKVEKLVFLDAFLPANGESVSSLARMIESKLPPDSNRLTIGKGLVIEKGTGTSRFKPEIADTLFYHDCTAADRAAAHHHLSRQSLAVLGTPVSLSDNIYGKIPKYYILCTESRDLDKSILPTRVPCEKVYSIRSGHSPFLSKPAELAEILNQL